MRTARRIAVLASFAAALGCGGSSDGSLTAPVDSVTLTTEAVAATYRDDVAGVSILAAAGSGTTLVTLDSSQSGAHMHFVLSIPAGLTGSGVAGTVTVIASMDGSGTSYSCAGPVAVNVTSHGTGLGGQVVGAFAATTIPCTIPPSSTLPVAAAFSATHL